MGEATLELRDLFKIIKRRKWIIMGMILFCVLCGLIISFIPQNAPIPVPPTVEKKTDLYKSTASVVIEKFPDFSSDNGKSIASLNVNQQVVKTYGAVANSRVVAEKTVKELNLNMKSEELINHRSVVVNSDTQLITIHYVEGIEGKQQEILNSYINNLIKEAQNVYPTGKLRVLDEPSPVEKITEDDFLKLIGAQTEAKTQAQANAQAQANIKATDQVKPKDKKLIIEISLILGIMMGFGLAFLLEYIDKSLKKREEAEVILKLSTLTIITKDESKEKVNIKEAFRMLRANLQLNDDKVITVTSPSKGDGKTMVSVNLAKAFAEAGFKTLIIDGNGRNPRINDNFNLQKTEGVSELLNDAINLSINDINLKILNTGNKNPNILSWGNEDVNPADLLSKSNLEELFNQLKEKFDYIVVDTTSMVNYSDAQFFSKVSDGNLIVATEGKTDIYDTVRMKELIDISGIAVRGLVWIER